MPYTRKQLRMFFAASRRGEWWAKTLIKKERKKGHLYAIRERKTNAKR